MTSNLSESDKEELRKQNLESIGTETTMQDLSVAMELSQRDEKARLDRLRQEEEELEKVCDSRTRLCSTHTHPGCSARRAS